MRGSRTYLVAILCTGATILAAGCGSDVTTQPGQAEIQQPTRPLTPNPLGTHALGSLAPSQYSAGVSFTIDPKYPTYVAIGPHFLYIPAGAVCNPMTSGYGVGTWSLACYSSTTAITVNAKAYLLNGHPVVEFDKHLRFKPSSDGSYDVMLYLRDDRADSRSKITWCPESGSLCIDESITAPWSSIRTWWDSEAFYVYRKIEHFSGYNVTGGREGCEDPSDPACQGGGGL
jgi:hypothetical protein